MAVLPTKNVYFSTWDDVSFFLFFPTNHLPSMKSFSAGVLVLLNYNVEDSVEARKRLSLNKEKYCNHPLDEQNPEKVDTVNRK